MEELISKLSDPSAWDDPKTAQELNKQKVNLEFDNSIKAIVHTIERMMPEIKENVMSNLKL